MPYPNEHSCRVKNPDAFQEDSFRRKKIEDGVYIIVGKLTGESTMTTQAYRFKTDNFTVTEAKKWLKDHDIKCIKFEPAEKNITMETIYKYGAPCGEIKDVDLQKRTVQAYYYNSQTVDSDNDIILPGAYAKSITERGPKSALPRIKHLFNHWDAAGVILELGEDENGGWFLSKLGRHQVGRDVLTMYDDGIITEHSHGFEVVKTDNDRIR